MLAEYAIVPDVFDAAYYSPKELCDVYLRHLSGPLREEALVRDLCDGEWREYIKRHLVPNNPLVKELLKKLVKQRRLRNVSPVQIDAPGNYEAWCQEAIHSHEQDPLTGIIATEATTKKFRREHNMASIEKLSNAEWWRERSPSRRLRRDTDSYLDCLNLVLDHATSFMFIDPHLNPKKYRPPNRFPYSEFWKLLRAAQNGKSQPPRIELHRSKYEDGRELRLDELQQDFFDGFRGQIERGEINPTNIEIYVWDKFHDRYLITNIIGITLSNGFDINMRDNREDYTIWARLGCADSGNVEKQFTPSRYPKRFEGSFSLE